MSETTCHKLKGWMKQYVEEMVDFRKRTALDVYYKAAEQPKVDVPDGFQKLVKTFKSSEMKTLQHVEEFRRKVAYEYKLHQCLVFLESIELGSVVITLWVPQSVVLVTPLLKWGSSRMTAIMKEHQWTPFLWRLNRRFDLIAHIALVC